MADQSGKQAIPVFQSSNLRFLLLILVSVLLSACGSLPSAGRSATSPESAEILVRQGKFSAASTMYESLAARASEETTRDHYLLLSAEVLIDNGLYTPGGQVRLAAIPETLSAPDLQSRLQILRAKEALISGDSAAALAMLPSPSTQHSKTHKARIYEIQANAYARQGAPADELIARINLENLLDGDEAKGENHRMIWSLLEEPPLETLRHMTTRVHNDIYQGWLELALILRSNTVRANSLINRVNNWKQRFPFHPVAKEFADELLALTVSSLPDEPLANHIAVLLPASGSAANAAGAIRDGLVTAYLESLEAASAPQLRFYDTGDKDFVEVYQRAIDDGASFIIGPLQKRSVSVLAQQESLPVPTLALNYTENNTPAPPNLFQFGLLPEDEAASAALRATQQGHESALILSSDDTLGTRLATAFRTSLEEAGGRVLADVVMPKADFDYSRQLRDVLHINQSNQRHRTLQSVAGTSLKFEPAIRRDIDIIYVTTDAGQARLIRPQLLFFRAREIPLLASSRIHESTSSPRKDRDLNGIVFSDTTWSLPVETAGDGVHDAIRRNWPDRQPSIRLFAMGADAYNVVPFLSSLQEDPYNRFAGSTGDLGMDAQNRLHRHLHWAVFEKGRARLHDGAARPERKEEEIPPQESF